MRRRDLDVLTVTGMAGAAARRPPAAFRARGCWGGWRGRPSCMGVRLVSKRLENLAGRTGISQNCRTPWGGHPEQWFFKS